MTVLFFGAGSRGDVQPMVALAMRARAEGHKVAVCASPDHAAFVTRFGLDFRPVGLDLREFLTGDAKDVATKGTFHTLKRFHEAIDAHLVAQMELLYTASADAELLFAGGVAMAAPTIAEVRKIPYRYVSYCPTTLPSREHAPVLVPWQGLPRMVNRGLWLTMSLVYDRLIGNPLNALRKGYDLEPIRDVLLNIGGAHVLLAADPLLGPAPRDAPMPVLSSAHETLQETAPLDTRTEAFIAAGPKPVFIGFGSMPDENPAQSTAIIAEAVRRAGVRAILSRGWAELGHGLDDENILVLDEAPHAALFSRMAAVVHHGGAGTTHTAARAGVPQVVVVHLMDQGYWAARVGALGLGPKAMRRKRLNAPELGAALRMVMSESRFAETARRFAQTMPEPPPFAVLLNGLGL